ncbi:PTS sugar transporter [Microbacterium sp. SYP-A9085]|uniref:PTS sugar transporter subunit IIB n=1 Tax=Microbacterium sp. SYP-A9085 TaxID=2664454 RepID=UPI00129BA65D|nr:PTS sugar transporter [Microbacterium sp. SYP-A9085]MRH28946.1 PTS sugar transporter [Microbacterium sp. SYP-A9085]
MRIIVMCAAGASSTFVAQRLRTAIAADGGSDTARAASLSSLPACLDDADVLLLGPHLSGHAAQLGQDAARRGVRVAVLPEDIFTDRDGHRALAIAAAATAPSTAAATAPTYAATTPTAPTAVPRQRAQERTDR